MSTLGRKKNTKINLEKKIVTKCLEKDMTKMGWKKIQYWVRGGKNVPGEV